MPIAARKGPPFSERERGNARYEEAFIADGASPAEAAARAAAFLSDADRSVPAVWAEEKVRLACAPCVQRLLLLASSSATRRRRALPARLGCKSARVSQREKEKARLLRRPRKGCALCAPRRRLERKLRWKHLPDTTDCAARPAGQAQSFAGSAYQSMGDRMCFAAVPWHLLTDRSRVLVCRSCECTVNVLFGYESLNSFANLAANLAHLLTDRSRVILVC